MKLGYNGTALTGPLTGVGQYTYQLGMQLQQMPDIELQVFYANHFEPITRPRNLPGVGQFRTLVRRFVPNAYGIAKWRRQRSFDRGVRAHGFDLYHEPNFLAYDFDGPLVLNVHDLSWIRYPQTHPSERVQAMHKYFEPGLRRAQVVLTLSEFVKREVMEVFGLPGERIRVTPCGLDLAYRPMPASQTLSV